MFLLLVYEHGSGGCTKVPQCNHVQGSESSLDGLLSDYRYRFSSVGSTGRVVPPIESGKCRME